MSWKFRRLLTWYDSRLTRRFGYFSCVFVCIIAIFIKELVKCLIIRHLNIFLPFLTMSDIYPNKPHVLTPGQKPLKLTENGSFPQLSTLLFHAKTFLRSSAQSVWLLHKRRAETWGNRNPKIVGLVT